MGKCNIEDSDTVIFISLLIGDAFRNKCYINIKHSENVIIIILSLLLGDKYSPSSNKVMMILFVVWFLIDVVIAVYIARQL